MDAMTRIASSGPRMSGLRMAMIALAALASALLLEGVLTEAEEIELAPVQREAYRRVVEAQKLLHEQRRRAVSADTLKELEANDPAGTGLVGLEWSHLVTTPGSYDAKILSCDPRWAILFCDFFARGGVESGSRVAIGSSASFPGLLLSARLAAEAMGARPVIAGSLTSSNFGATVPEFDLYHMEEVLLRSGAVEYPMELLTPGGEQDALYGFAMEDRAGIERRLDEIADKPRGPLVAWPGGLEESIELRDGMLLADGAAIFVNIGGHSANYGVGAAALALPTGYTEPSALNLDYTNGDSAALRALRRGIPVANMINIRGIAMSHGALFSGGNGKARLVEKHWPLALRIAAFLVVLGCLAACFAFRFKEPVYVDRHPGGPSNAR